MNKLKLLLHILPQETKIGIVLQNGCAYYKMGWFQRLFIKSVCSEGQLQIVDTISAGNDESKSKLIVIKIDTPLL